MSENERKLKGAAITLMTAANLAENKGDIDLARKIESEAEAVLSALGVVKNIEVAAKVLSELDDLLGHNQPQPKN